MNKDWQKTTIGELGHVVTGTTPSPAVPGFYGGDIPFVTPGDLGKSLLVYDSARTLTQAGLERAKSIPPGAILYTCIGATIGKSAIAARELATNQQINSVICYPDKIDNRFLYYLLQFLTNGIKELAGTQAVPIVNKSTFENVTAAIPPLAEQQKIVEILLTWDEAIEKLEMIIEREKRRNFECTHSLVFGARRLSQFKKTHQFKVYRWFALPEEWDILPIGELATEVSERNDGHLKNLEVLSCSKHSGFVRSLEYFNKQIFSANLAGYKIIHRGDFGFPSNHVEEGSVGLQNVVDIGIVSPIYTVFRFATDRINRSFAFNVLKTNLYRHIFEISTSASVNRRGSLRWKEFKKIPFPVPPRDEQDAISDILTTSLRKLTALEKQRGRYIHQKTGLMQKLLTGIWRVNEIDSKCNTEP